MPDQWETGYSDGRQGKPRDDTRPTAYAFGWHEGYKARSSAAFRELISAARKESGYGD
jgi:hypothetical protein